MQKLFFSLFLTVSTIAVNAQLQTMDLNAHLATAPNSIPAGNSIPFNNLKYAEAQGSPYFEDMWEMGVVVTRNGEVYKDVPVRIDFLANNVQYLTRTGNHVVLSTPLREIKIKQTKTELTVHFINGEFLPAPKTGWFQILVNDSLAMVKSVKRTMESHASYNSASENYIKSIEKYIVFYNNKEYEVKKESHFIDLFPQYRKDIEAEMDRIKKFTKENKLVAIAALVSMLLKQP